MGTASYSSDESEAAAPAQTEQAAPTAPAQSAPAEGIIDVLEAKVKALETKIASLESEGLTAVHNRIQQVESFLKSKYPYSL